jgi:hypothetical protein
MFIGVTANDQTTDGGPPAALGLSTGAAGPPNSAAPGSLLAVWRFWSQNQAASIG